jgi:hypothetical protein
MFIKVCGHTYDIMPIGGKKAGYMVCSHLQQQKKSYSLKMLKKGWGCSLVANTCLTCARSWVLGIAKTNKCLRKDGDCLYQMIGKLSFSKEIMSFF